MTSTWLIDIGGENAVPKGKIEAIVGVSLLVDDRMMHAVHIGCDDNLA